MAIANHRRRETVSLEDLDYGTLPIHRQRCHDPFQIGARVEEGRLNEAKCRGISSQDAISSHAERAIYSKCYYNPGDKIFPQH